MEKRTKHKWRDIVSVLIDELIKQIEELRLDLVRIKIGRAYTDPEVIEASQKLDNVLNKYQELVRLNNNDN